MANWVITTNLRENWGQLTRFNKTDPRFNRVLKKIGRTYVGGLRQLKPQIVELLGLVAWRELLYYVKYLKFQLDYDTDKLDKGEIDYACQHIEDWANYYKVWLGRPKLPKQKES